MDRRTALAGLGTAAGLALAGAAAWRGLAPREVPGEPIRLRFSHVVAENTPKGKAANYFRDLVAERTGGRVVVEVYPNSELYKDKEELEAVQLGSVQMVAPSLAKLGPLGIREFELFDLPFLFADVAAVHRVVRGEVGRRLLARLDGTGLLGLAFWDNGFKHMTAGRPLLDVSDFAGLRMRIQASQVLDAQMRALGAIPDVTALADVYAALQSGVDDGTENTASNLYTQHLHEVQRYLTLSSHGYLGYVVIVNERFWRALPGDLHDVLAGAVADAAYYASEIARSENELALARIRAAGTTRILAPTPAQLATWRAALSGVRAGFQARVGGRWLESVDEVTGARPASGWVGPEP